MVLHSLSRCLYPGAEGALEPAHARSSAGAGHCGTLLARRAEAAVAQWVSG